MRKPSKTVPRPRSTATTRCAIYTRKSSEEGLEQEFNSLHAQREACEAYVLSQRHEGWSFLPQIYDDGGFSGGTMERPALARLLADSAAGKIDTVVVYKVDRLTRSLSDFAKIVDIFDAAQVSFVSVTQAFNTTNSMGRLTLNMLLSFAQFEREVTGERIRDKIAASKRKGMWMGGLPPLGYDAVDRKLVVNEAEAETVRHIFRRCEHEAIVDEALWTKVQSVLAQYRGEAAIGIRSAEPSLLAGFIYDDAGERMIPTHAVKKGTRYRYYVSQPLHQKGKQHDTSYGQRVPAGDLETLVAERLTRFLRDEAAFSNAIGSAAKDVTIGPAMVDRAAQLAGRWPQLQPSTRRAMLQRLVKRIDVKRETVELTIRPCAIAAIVDPGFDPVRPTGEVWSPVEGRKGGDGEEQEPTAILSVSAQLKRTGRETRFLIEGHAATSRREPDRSLLRLLAQAQRFQTMLMQGQGRSVTELAEEAGVTASYFTRILRLSFLAPSAVQMIIDGEQPAWLSAKHLSLHIKLPNSWSNQAKLLASA